MNDDSNVRIGKSDDDSNDTEMIVTSDNNSVILVNIQYPYSVGEYRFYLNCTIFRKQEETRAFGELSCLFRSEYK